MNRTTWLKVIAVDMLLVCFSLNVSVIGQMLESIKETYMLNLTQSGMLVSVQSIGGLVLAILCILYIDALNKTRFLVICGFVLCLMLMAIGAIPPLFLLFVIFALSGFSGGAVNTLTNPVLLETVPRRPERFIAFMHMLFSLFAIIAPIIAQTLYDFGGLTGVFLIIGGFGLCWACYAQIIFRGQMPKSVVPRLSFGKRLLVAKDVFLKPGMKQILFLSTMMAAWQLGAIYFASSYIRDLGGTAHEGAMALSVLFGGMMLSRLLYSRIADKFSPVRVLMLTNLMGILAWAGLLIADGIAAKTIIIGITAFFCANNFPIAFYSTYRIAPENSASASGFVVFGYYIATFAFIPIIGALGDTMGLGHAFLFIGIPLLFVLLAAYMLQKRMADPRVR